MAIWQKSHPGNTFVYPGEAEEGQREVFAVASLPQMPHKKQEEMFTRQVKSIITAMFKMFSCRSFFNYY